MNQFSKYPILQFTFIFVLFAPVLSLQARRKALTPEEITERYGDTFGNYCDGRAAMARGDWEYAEGQLRVAQIGPLADEARFYLMQCALRQAKWKDAAQTLETFTKYSQTAPHIYEGFLEKAYLDLLLSSERKVDKKTEKAKETLTQAIELYEASYAAWEKDFQRSQNIPLLLEILKDESPSANIQDDFPVGNKLSFPGQTGWPGPESIFNRKTSNWYLAYIKCQIHQYYAFLELLNDDAEAAKKQLAHARAALPTNQISAQSYLARTEFCLRQGAYLFTKEEWDSFRSFQVPLQLAAFLTVTHQKDIAMAITDELLSNFERKMSDQEKAAALFIKLLCLRQYQKVSAADELQQSNQRLLENQNYIERLTFIQQLRW